DEQREVLRSLKEHLAHLPTLARHLGGGGIIFLYVADSLTTVSAVLLKEEDKVPKPKYFVSHTLTRAKTRYPLLERVACAVVIAAKKLMLYLIPPKSRYSHINTWRKSLRKERNLEGWPNEGLGSPSLE
ncbi:Dihydrofolate reductase type 15, partial [Bienertia sinuspersici]